MKRVARAVRACIACLAFVVLTPVVAWTAASPEQKCVSAKFDAGRAFAVCVLRAKEKNVRKPGSANEAVCGEKLVEKWNAIEAKAGPGICPTERHDLGGVVTHTLRLAEESDLAIRPPTELVVFDAGPASGMQLGEHTPHGRCSPGNTEELTCRRMPALVSDLG